MATRLTEREIVADAIKEVLNTYGDDEKLKVLLAPGAELKFGLFCIKIVKLISTSVSVKPQIAFKRFHQLSVSKLLISRTGLIFFLDEVSTFSEPAGVRVHPNFVVHLQSSSEVCCL